MPFKDMSMEEYHNHPALGSSDLRLILQNPRVFKSIRDGKIDQEPTQQMEFGTMIHEYLLDKPAFDRKYVISKATDKRQKDYKDLKKKFEEEGIDVTILTAPEYEAVLNMANKVLNKQLIIEDDNGKVIFKAGMDKILEKAASESSWFCDYEGVELKCRPDILINIGRGKPYYIVIDLKTTNEPTKDNFIRSGGRYYYHLQDYHYRQVLKANDIEVQEFLFLMIGKSDGTHAEFYRWTHTALELASELWNKAIQKYKYCRDNDKWYEAEFDFFANRFNTITTCDLPNYMYYLY